jgi:hypothetical protein
MERQLARPGDRLPGPLFLVMVGLSARREVGRADLFPGAGASSVFQVHPIEGPWASISKIGFESEQNCSDGSPRSGIILDACRVLATPQGATRDNVEGIVFGEHNRAMLDLANWVRIRFIADPVSAGRYSSTPFPSRALRASRRFSQNRRLALSLPHRRVLRPLSGNSQATLPSPASAYATPYAP